MNCGTLCGRAFYIWVTLTFNLLNAKYHQLHLSQRMVYQVWTFCNFILLS